MRVVVTGASRGIGRELVHQLVARGDEVIAGMRTPHELPGARVLPLDVADAASVAAFARSIEGALDLVINNAGVYGGPTQSLRQMAEDLELPDVRSTFDINATGALRVSIALLAHLRRGSAKKLAHITSKMGSIGDNTTGGYYAYRMSKAALNMMSRSLAIDLCGEGFISIVLNPGWVQTEMGGTHAPLPVRESARNLLLRIDAATSADSGEFLDWKGGRVEW
jgi:NAD(P)-dependent dehydrogenase (short-subunit alcohol dehydrogenase family)